MYVKKDLVLIMTIKNIIKSDIIVIILENIEELLTIFISDIKHQKKFLYYFIVVLHKIIIL